MELLTKVWTWIRKYSGLLIGILIAGLAAIALGRKPTATPVIPTDADNNGQNDEQEIEHIQQEAAEHREVAERYVEAAQDAVATPIAVTPSRNVRDAVDRNNESDA